MLRQPFSSVVYSVLLALLFTAGSVQAQTVVSENGDFEDAEAGQTSGITNWALQGTDYADYEVVEDPDDSENFVLQVTLTDIDGAAEAWDIQALHQNTPLTAGTEYQASVRVRAENPTDGSISLDPSGNAPVYGAAVSGDDWQTVQTDPFTVDEDGTLQTAVHFGNDGNANGQIFYIDDLQIMALDDDEPDDEDLVASWDFEDEDLDNWAAGDGTVSIEVSDEQADDSDYAVKLVNSDDHLQINLQNDNLGDVVQAGDVVSARIWISQEHLDDVNGFSGFWQDEGDAWAWNDQWLGKDDVTGDAWSTLEFTIDEIVEPLNRVGFQLSLADDNEATEAVLYVDNITINRPAPAEEPVPVTEWGFDRDDGWSIETGDPGNVTVSGESSPSSGWMALRGGFGELTPDVGEALVVTGTMELTGGGFEGLEGLRYGVFHDNGGGGSVVEGSWDGAETGYDGYLFLPVTSPVNWQCTDCGDATFGGVVNSLWFSTNAADSYDLGDTTTLPDGAAGPEGTYEFAFSFAPQEGGQMEVSFYLINDDESFYFADTVTDEHDPLTTSAFNSIGFALGNGSSATSLALSDVTVDLGEPIEIPAPPVPPAAIGETINPNGSFAESELGANTADGWSFQTASGGEGTFTIVNDSQDADSLALQVELNNLGTTTDDWNVEAVNEPFNVEEGATYQYTVWMKADNDERTARIILGQPESGNWARPIQSDVELTTEWQRFAYLHTASESEASTGMRAPISLNMPGNDTETTIFIDNLNVVKISEEGETLPGETLAFWTFEDVAEADTNANGHLVYDGWANGSEPTDGSAVLTTERAYIGTKSVQITSTENSAEARFRRNGPYPDLTEDWVFQFWVWISSEDLEDVDHVRGYYQDTNFAQPGAVSDTLWASEVTADSWNMYEFRIPAGYDEPMNRVGLVLAATSEEATPSIYVDGAVIREDPVPDAVAPEDVPHAFALEQNYPNPFNPTTTIEYVLDANTHVTLAVYNTLGQRVATLVDAQQTAGQHHAQFDARGFASGMYFYRITAGDHIMTRQMTLVK